MWCIGELELPYQRHDVGHRYGGTDTDEFYRLNPNRTVLLLINMEQGIFDLMIYWRELKLIVGWNGQS